MKPIAYDADRINNLMTRKMPALHTSVRTGANLRFSCPQI